MTRGMFEPVIWPEKDQDAKKQEPTPIYEKVKKDIKKKQDENKKEK